MSRARKTTLDVDLVARRAYELFLARGGEHGRDLDDWLRAEQELGAPSMRSSRSGATTTPGRTGISHPISRKRQENH